jgi:oligopeptide transport system substrate-binding protein
VIDKEKITREVKRMGESPSNVLVPVNSVPFYQGPAGLARNVELAKKLLADAGYPDGKGFPEFEFLYNNEAGHDKVAQAVGQMWQMELGITPKYLGVELNSFRSARKNHNFAVARGGWYGDYTDPQTWLDLCQSKDNNNDSQFASPAFDALLAKAAAEADRDKRFAILRDAERLLVEDEFPYIPLYQYSDGFMFDEKKVGGITLDVRLMTQFKYLYKKDAK